MARPITHGMTNTPIYITWCKMIQRCTNPKDIGWHDYGGRGITVCKRWHSFENFYADMGDRPKGMSIERKKNHIGYCKSNCKWATRKEQQSNTRQNVYLEFKGKNRTVAQWSRRLKVSPNVLYGRLRRGWSVAETLS